MRLAIVSNQWIFFYIHARLLSSAGQYGQLEKRRLAGELTSAQDMKFPFVMQ